MLVNSADIFRDELNPSERIIWSGQPQQGLLLEQLMLSCYHSAFYGVVLYFLDCSVPYLMVPHSFF